MQGAYGMMVARKLLVVLSVAFSVVTLGYAQGTDSASGDADVTIELNNVESVAWVVGSVENAESVAELDTRNPTLSLTVGTRYRFDNNGGAAHPLDFRTERSRFLLAQGGTEGTFEGDPDVNFIDDEEGVTFTLTQELADEIAIYYCTVHPDMVGDVIVGGGE